MKKLVLGATEALGLLIGQVQAGVIFSFTESNGDVIMTSSGTLDVSGLVSQGLSGWGDGGIQNTVSLGSDAMGDTTIGSLDQSFGFNAETDLSPWYGDMFFISNFDWITTGTTQFATYYWDSSEIMPGIGLSSADLVGDIWTPDVSWVQTGTFASIGLTEGDYTITDALTGEFISIQIGNVATPPLPVPEPASVALLGLSLLGFGVAKRKK